jgi:hypothetical protein
MLYETDRIDVTASPIYTTDALNTEDILEEVSNAPSDIEADRIEAKILEDETLLPTYIIEFLIYVCTVVYIADMRTSILMELDIAYFKIRLAKEITSMLISAYTEKPWLTKAKTDSEIITIDDLI